MKCLTGCLCVGIMRAWGENKVQVAIVDVYNPCELNRKKEVWDGWDCKF